MLLYTTNIRSSKGTRIIIFLFLKFIAFNFNNRKSLNRYLTSKDGWLNFSIGLKTEDNSLQYGISFFEGKVAVTKTIAHDAKAVMIFKNDEAARKLLLGTPTDVIYMLLKSDVRIEGSISYANIFSFFISLLFHDVQKRAMKTERKKDDKTVKRQQPEHNKQLSDEIVKRRKERLKAEGADPHVVYLDDAYLSKYSMDDFPRLQRFLHDHLTKKPAVCAERAYLLTKWYRENGFEKDSSGNNWDPIVRNALAYKYMMENRKPLINDESLLAGTTTSKPIGCPIYPDGSGIMIWNELMTISYRTYNPFDIDEQTREVLHFDVFPFWLHRNFREWVRDKYNNPLSQQLDERYALYFNWKQATISHTIPNFPKVLAMGTLGMIQEMHEELNSGCGEEKQNCLTAMILCLEGVNAYAQNLSKQAMGDSNREQNPQRKQELLTIADICSRIPMHGAQTLHEAVMAVWIIWIALHMESMNAGLSLGRLDQWLQPYFVNDMKNIPPEKRDEYMKFALELIGDFYMRCTDHFPLTPDLANFYFGGSSSDQAITLGGVTPEGTDAVCDMTYIFLKVTEMLSVRDPNVNARYMPGVNSDTYLKRLCEVNLITAATPSMHNDAAIIKALTPMGYPINDIRDWSATGCVEPTLSHKHFGHTNMQMMNMVAALEMTLNNGYHPLTRLDVGPKTGRPEDGVFTTFDTFFDAFTQQFAFLIDQSIDYNNKLAEAHQLIRPTPLLSAFIEGCLEKGKDVTMGGAKYNSSGTAIIGLADVTDSMMAIKKLVYDEKRYAFADIKKAVDSNFAHDAVLLSLVHKKIPLFGSGSDEAVAMANRITTWAHDHYSKMPHYRGGAYATGFWSMSNHVAFGTLTGALPSGRLAGKPFTPGLTPQPFASKNLLDNIRDVARLNPENCNNNIAFNVKVVPSAIESRQKTVNDMFSYVKTYFELGGMQMQMNVVTSAVLRDAMAHPENYRNLIVRISGYNAYFVTLNRQMQLELIERAEYGI
ncbi:MAG TPA: pyruvate formate lyase family protein [Spirochaetota bacterium]|nr:pyruvate formate lyase family protein [Spirochaetota bacterium]HOR93432.1 pyruvate formate lyase family protein [Spirochaetota bacterium]HPD05230.1 pyruvate formate lyase family protein [Spirochaetota bacterium]HQG41348.1 pyruvate formate lyase family protein [Spirochaetota bacterium]HRR61116.1 pyruvate formate lyase family protein [Spirochaetota bacterium]